MCLVILICCVVEQSCSHEIQLLYYCKVLTVDYTIHVYMSLHVSLYHSEEGISS